MRTIKEFREKNYEILTGKMDLKWHGSGLKSNNDDLAKAYWLVTLKNLAHKEA